MRRINNSNGPSMSWTSIIIASVAVAGFSLTVAASGWGIFQTQFAAQNSLIQDNKNLIEKKIGQPEFKQFELRIQGNIETIQKQLSILEQTRPTTGELQAASKNSSETASKLEERVALLKQYLLGQSKGFSAQPQR